MDGVTVWGGAAEPGRPRRRGGWIPALGHLNDRRIERYYRRTLTDRDLAARWQAHYFRGLDVAPGAAVLDHGCGRGRNAAILQQLGYRVGAQDTSRHPWWNQIAGCAFQQVPADAPHLPWADRSFDVVLDVTVLNHLDRAEVQHLADEVCRVLVPGGLWIVVDANADSYGARALRAYYGRLHTVGDVQDAAQRSGFHVRDHTYEGWYAPVAPMAINFIRKQLSPRAFSVDDFESVLARMTPARRRALWVLRMQKPMR